MDNITIQDKMQKVLEIICTLYKKDSIKEAYIVGSFAKSVIENIPFKETSDIDIIIVNPLFENPGCELDPGDVNMPVYVKNVATYVNHCSNDTPSEMRLAKGHLDFIHYSQKMINTDDYTTINNLLSDIGMTFKKCNCQ